MKIVNRVVIIGLASCIFLAVNSLVCYGQVSRSQDLKRSTALPPAVQRAPMPDLVITNVTGVPDEITNTDGFGPIFYATVTVKNIGNADAWFPPQAWIIGGPSQYTNISAGQITNSQTTANTAIRPGETKTATLAGKIQCFRGDPLEVRFQVDPQNRVRESNEPNNEWKKLVAYRAVTGQNQLPDLVIDSVSFSPPNPTHYDRIMIRVDMRNNGAGPAIFCTGNTEWMAMLDMPGGGGAGGTGERVVRPNEAFFGGVIIVEPNTRQKGCYRYRVTVDPKNAIAESNENNNTRIAYLSIEGGDCSQLKAEDMRPKPGQMQQMPAGSVPPGVNTLPRAR